jgi:hypothetical protein
MKKLLYTAAALFVLSTISSCKKFMDVNTNPNAPVTTDASNLMPPMLAGMERGVWFDSRYIGQYSQQWSAPGTDNIWDREGYAAASDAAGEMWRTHYFSLGANTFLMRNDAMAKKNYDYVGASYAMLAWSWQNCVDLYNNMPLKEAFDETKLTFNYDEPQDIYTEVVSECKSALNYFYLSLQNSQPDVSANFARGDYMYYGDRRKWIKFTYAVLAVNASHLSNKASYNPDLVIKYVDSSFTNNTDNASIQNTGSQSGDSNFWGTVRQNLNGFRQSDFMVRLLDGRILANLPSPNITLDPRLPQLLTASGDGQYRGVTANNGDPNSVDVNTSIPYLWGTPSTSALPAANLATAKYIFRDDARGVLMTYSMLQFIKAEALFRKGDKPGALDAYKKGIDASIDFVSNPPTKNVQVGATNYISATAKAAYLAGPCVRQDANSLQMSDIMQQKFIALFGWGQLEAWADLRRFRYDTSIFQGFVKPGSLSTDNGGKQVYRVRPRYNSEYIWNIPSLQRIGALQPDYHTKEPWFILP